MISDNIFVRIYKIPEDELRKKLNLLGENLVIQWNEAEQRYFLQTEEKITSSK